MGNSNCELLTWQSPPEHFRALGMGFSHFQTRCLGSRRCLEKQLPVIHASTPAALSFFQMPAIETSLAGKPDQLLL